MNPEHRRLIVRIFLIILAVAVAFHAAPKLGFVYMDDFDYIESNKHIHDGVSLHGLIWALTTPHSFNWHPVTWISHMLDVELFGLNPGGHHIDSVLLHLAVSILLFLGLFRLTSGMGESFAVALIFAVHPLAVEPVAWLAQRKTLVCALFWLLSIGAYVAYVRRPTASRYAALVFLFVLGLLSKQSLVVLPALLLLLDLWPLNRVRIGPALRIEGNGVSPGRLVAEKIPLFIISIGFTVVAALIQYAHGAMAAGNSIPLWARMANVPVVIMKYILHLVWPAGLGAFYPHPETLVSLTASAFSVMAILAITICAVRIVRPAPYVFVGWMWFLISILPLSGIVQIGMHELADRYMYGPVWGLLVMFVWGASDVARRIQLGPMFKACALAGIAVLLIVLTTAYVPKWTSAEIFFRHIISVTDGNWRMHRMLGNYLYQSGRAADAEAEYEHAVEINPNDVYSLSGLSAMAAARGDQPRAADLMRRAHAAYQIIQR